MTTRSTAWILLAALLLQALVAVVPGGSVVLCLGGDHDHEHEHDHAAASSSDHGSCESACGHHNDAHLPTLQTPHAQDCSCLDIEIAALDLRFRTTTVDDHVPAPAPLAAPLARACTPPAPRATASRHGAGLAPPPPDPSLGALRTVRILT